MRPTWWQQLGHIGHGVQVGALRPEIGDGFAQLACDACGATWTGPPGEVCEYCAPDAQERRVAAERRRADLAKQLRNETVTPTSSSEAHAADLSTIYDWLGLS